MTAPFAEDFNGFDGIDPPVDDVAAGMVGLYVDRIDPTARSMGAAYMQAADAIANVMPPNTAHTAGVAPDGRVDQVA
jgi:hypothetical protein